MMNTMFNFIGSERQIEWAKKIVSGPYDFLMYIASTAEEEIKAHGEVSTYCEEVKFYSEAAKRYESEIKKFVQAMSEVKAGLVIDRRENYGKLADMILAEVLKENGKRGLVDAGWRPTWDMKKMGF